MSNETMTDARALAEKVVADTPLVGTLAGLPGHVQGVVQAYGGLCARKAVNTYAARLRGEAAQGEQQAVAMIGVPAGPGAPTLRMLSIDLPPGQHKVYTRPQPAATTPVAGDAVAVDDAMVERGARVLADMNGHEWLWDGYAADARAVLEAALAQDRASQGCGACGDGCQSRESCRLADDSPSQGAAAGVPEGWRMLRPGEVIERDDQFLQGDSITWEKATLLVIGMEYRPGVLHPARRLAAAPIVSENEKR